MRKLKAVGERAQGLISVLASLLLIFTPLLDARITMTLGCLLLIFFLIMEFGRKPPSTDGT